jgi:hypothetical protein
VISLQTCTYSSHVRRLPTCCEGSPDIEHIPNSHPRLSPRHHGPITEERNQETHVLDSAMVIAFGEACCPDSIVLTNSLQALRHSMAAGFRPREMGFSDLSICSGPPLVKFLFLTPPLPQLCMAVHNILRGIEVVLAFAQTDLHEHACCSSTWRMKDSTLSPTLSQIGRNVFGQEVMPILYGNASLFIRRRGYFRLANYTRGVNPSALILRT